MSVQAIIDAHIALAERKAGQSEAYGGQAVNSATGNPDVQAPTIDSVGSVREPGVSIPSRASGADMALFESTYDRVMTDFTDKYAEFLVRFFPQNLALMNAVESWLQSAISGGTGINSNVERQIWQRDRDRITNEFQATSDEAISAWAAKGFPLPPGAAVGALADITIKRAHAIAAISRDAAIKAWDTEIENVRFAITSAIDLRSKAIAAAGDFIRALAVAPQLAAQMSTQAADAQARLISAAASFYNARISAEELVLRHDIAQADLDFKAADSSARNRVEYVQAKVQAATAVTQSLGQQAAAALNAVSATAQISESAE